ncbi:MAG TPA: isochorismatase [Blastocatellia bacterium]|nr:isochorismatase [Blastocatellia bacterium]
MDHQAKEPRLRLEEPYEARPIRFLELWEDAGWRLKVYGIAYRRERPRQELIEAARQAARDRLPRPAVTDSRYGVGFLGIHDGRGANFVFLDWWQDENELHHHVYVSPHDRPQLLEYSTPTGVVACVWDLRVLGFERQAWLDAVLANPNGPDIDDYLARRLDEDV